MKLFNLQIYLKNIMTLGLVTSGAIVQYRRDDIFINLWLYYS